MGAELNKSGLQSAHVSIVTHCRIYLVHGTFAQHEQAHWVGDAAPSRKTMLFSSELLKLVRAFGVCSFVRMKSLAWDPTILMGVRHFMHYWTQTGPNTQVQCLMVLFANCGYVSHL